MFKNDKPRAEHYPAGDKIILHRIEVLSQAVDNVIQYGDVVINSYQSDKSAAETSVAAPQGQSSASVSPQKAIPVENGLITLEDARHQVDDSFDGKAA